MKRYLKKGKISKINEIEAGPKGGDNVDRGLKPGTIPPCSDTRQTNSL